MFSPRSSRRISIPICPCLKRLLSVEPARDKKGLINYTVLLRNGTHDNDIKHTQCWATFPALVLSRLHVTLTEALARLPQCSSRRCSEFRLLLVSTIFLQVVWLRQLHALPSNSWAHNYWTENSCPWDIHGLFQKQMQHAVYSLYSCVLDYAHFLDMSIVSYLFCIRNSAHMLYNLHVMYLTHTTLA